MSSNGIGRIWSYNPETKKWKKATEEEAPAYWAAQIIKLNLGESPFYSDWGIPIRNLSMNGTSPRYYLERLYDKLSPWFMTWAVSGKITGKKAIFEIQAVGIDGKPHSLTIDSGNNGRNNSTD